MTILLICGVALFFVGRKVRRSSVYPNGGQWPLRQVLASLPSWQIDRAVQAIGGATLQFAGVIIVISASPLRILLV